MMALGRLKDSLSITCHVVPHFWLSDMNYKSGSLEDCGTLRPVKGSIAYGMILRASD